MKPVDGVEILSLEELGLEAFYLGLRTKKGIHLQDFTERHGGGILIGKGKALVESAKRGLISIENGYISPTRAGFSVADRLALL